MILNVMKNMDFYKNYLLYIHFYKQVKMYLFFEERVGRAGIILLYQ